MKEKKAFSSTDFFVLVATIIWGTDYIFGKIALREVSPMSFAAMRTLFSTVILLPLFIKLEKNWLVSLPHFCWLVGLAFLGIFINRVFWSVGLSLTTASNSALLFATSPIFLLIVHCIFLRTKVTIRTAVGILISFVGVFLVIYSDQKGSVMGLETLYGDLMVILGAVSWALFTFLAKRLLKEYSSLKVMAYLMIIGTIFYLPFLPNDKAGGWWKISTLAWFSVIYVATMGNCLAYFLWIQGIHNIGSLRTILYQSFIPVTTILFANLFLKETMTAQQVFGAAVVISGILLARSGEVFYVTKLLHFFRLIKKAVTL